MATYRIEEATFNKAEESLHELRVVEAALQKLWDDVHEGTPGCGERHELMQGLLGGVKHAMAALGDVVYGAHQGGLAEGGTT